MDESKKQKNTVRRSQSTRANKKKGTYAVRSEAAKMYVGPRMELTYTGHSYMPLVSFLSLVTDLIHMTGSGGNNSYEWRMRKQVKGSDCTCACARKNLECCFSQAVALLVPASSLQEETMDIGAIARCTRDFIRVLLQHFSLQDHLVKRPFLAASSGLHDGSEERHGVEETRDPHGLGEVQVGSPVLQAGNR